MCSCPGPATTPGCMRALTHEPTVAGELDLPDRDQPDGYLQLAQALARTGGQTLAIDTPSSPGPGRYSTAELRAERDRLRRQLDQAPATAAAESWPGPPPTASRLSRSLPPTNSPSVAGRPACFVGCAAEPTDPPSCLGGLAVATQQANRAHDRGARAAPAPATPRRLAGSQRPPRPPVSAGRADPELAAARHRPGRRSRPARLCPGGPGAGAGISTRGRRGLAPGRP